MSIEKIRFIARSYFEGVAPSHDWQHVTRVHELSLHLASEEDADSEIVSIASLLHDIGRKKEEEDQSIDHAEWSAEESKKILSQFEFDQSFIQNVSHSILSHRYSNSIEPESIEAKTLSDADNLDAMGAIGIARAFSFSGENDRLLMSMNGKEDNVSVDGDTTALEHLYEKILSLKSRMYTETGKRIAEDRHNFVQIYVDRLEEELNSYQA